MNARAEAPDSAPQKLLVIELAGLGDNVHLLPALWLVRRQWPGAELHVMVNANVASLFKLTPWVDRLWSYPTAPKPGVRENLRWASALRREHFDCVINTTGSDRSSLLTWATRARERIGRRPADGGPPGWRWLFTRVVETSHYLEPMYLQKWRCLKQAGFDAGASAGDSPEFHVTIDPALRRSAGIGAEDEGRYIHISPFTTADARELPREQMVTLIAGLRADHPDFREAAGVPVEYFEAVVLGGCVVEEDDVVLGRTIQDLRPQRRRCIGIGVLDLDAAQPVGDVRAREA